MERAGAVLYATTRIALKNQSRKSLDWFFLLGSAYRDVINCKTKALKSADLATLWIEPLFNVRLYQDIANIDPTDYREQNSYPSS